MNDHADFLRMICQHPDDDAPRLVFADWLDEQGDADRAELIRLGVRLGNSTLSDDERWSAGVRYRQLEVVVTPRLLDELPRIDGLAWHAIIDRGFVARITVYDPVALCTHWPQLFESSPIRYLRLHDLGAAHVNQLADVPVLAQIRSIELRGALLLTHGFRSFVNLPTLHNLLHLDCTAQGLGDAGAESLVHATPMQGLRSLNLSDNNITDVGGRFLAEYRGLKQLELLYLSRNQLSGSMLTQLRGRYRNVLVGV